MSNGNKGGHKGGGVAKILLRVIVNTVEVEVSANPNQTLGSVAEQALEKSENLGQPLDDWSIFRQGESVALDFNTKVGAYNFPEGQVLLLSPKAGITG